MITWRGLIEIVSAAIPHKQKVVPGPVEGGCTTLFFFSIEQGSSAERHKGTEKRKDGAEIQLHFVAFSLVFSMCRPLHNLTVYVNWMCVIRFPVRSAGQFVRSSQALFADRRWRKKKYVTKGGGARPSPVRFKGRLGGSHSCVNEFLFGCWESKGVQVHDSQLRVYKPCHCTSWLFVTEVMGSNEP